MCDSWWQQKAGRPPTVPPPLIFLARCSSATARREAISKVWSDCEQADIHLVKFEDILFSAVRASYCLVAI